ncbi:TPA: MBL fold metallo-hydrolase [Elizabethkingia meningoseptica]|uniref:MBL fold metallo-hydrolase n=1 Tax=Elizabethkingia meningoseptica TaxID=238 RepID=UPI0022F171D7|nr:MBL fold metallo-hydrolase [Elizabethkingia meningoseptica]EJK5330267.1 MBL fold metallo-hydrolase [Elizabethkingia meningoseptica]WBS73157.1 MBL fold metallo-hydrolase [Elizabethkingia meningoseptica]HAY3563987.1 MBL fold metallo-hydrolase [Elizabethkingia meningoseptica]
MRDKIVLRFIIFIGILCLNINHFLFGQTAPYQIKLGEIKVTALTDGTLPIDVEKLFDTGSPGKPTELANQAFLQNPVEVSINVYLIQYGNKNILVDSGSGELFGKYGGKLAESLKQTGITPEQITDILITHIHADHSGGLVIAGKKIFSKAIIHINKAELDFWLKEENKQKADDRTMGANEQTFRNAQDMITPYLQSKQVITFSGETENIVPYISAMPYPGHTPGHTIYVLNNTTEKVYFWGDLIHVPGLQFINPSLHVHFDVDMKEGKLKRNSFYERAASDKFLIAGAHISFPGIGHLKKNGTEYIWMPIPFSIEGRTR